ncbi:MAG: sugar ABC transporter substrate-binding protein [Ignavibacteriae bacterium]|nr:sugar ABC transporter substrate-binding protein [Ignavibacteriota bacterium]
MKVYIKILPIIILLFISCKSEKIDNNITTIKFWGLGAEGEYVQKLLPEFYKKHPKIKVNVQAIPWTAAQEKLISAYASDNLPDVFQLGNTWVPQFVSLNALENLDKYLNISGSINKENYFEGIWNTNIIDGSLFGIPWYIDTRIVFYRKDVLAKAGYSVFPKTWDELYDASKKIKSLHKNEEKYAIFLPTNEWASFIIFALQNNSTILKDNNRYGAFSEKEFKEAFEYIIKFHKEDLAPIGFSQVTNVYQAFAEEYFSMYISGPWNIPEFKKWMTGNLADKWGTAPMPSKDGNYPGTSLAGGSSLVVSSLSANKDSVWKFIEFLSDPNIQLKFYNMINDLPSVVNAWNDSSFSNNEYMQAFFAQFHNVTETPKITEWEQIAFAKIQQYAELAARNSLTIDEALKALDKDVNKILEKRRWLLNKK